MSHNERPTGSIVLFSHRDRRSVIREVIEQSLRHMPLSCRGLGDLWVREPQTLRHRIGRKVCGITGVLILKASGIGTWCPQMSQIIFVAYRYKLPTIEWQSKTCLSSIVGLVDVYNDACTIS